MRAEQSLLLCGLNDLTCPRHKAPVSGVRAMTKATDRFLTAVRRFRIGVYSSVEAAEEAMMRRSAGGSCKAMCESSQQRPA